MTTKTAQKLETFLAETLEKYRAHFARDTTDAQLEIECRLGKLQDNLKSTASKKFFNTFLPQNYFQDLLNYFQSQPDYHEQQSSIRYCHIDGVRVLLDETDNPIGCIQKQKCFNADFHLIGSPYDVRLSITREQNIPLKTLTAHPEDITIQVNHRSSFTKVPFRYDLTSVHQGQQTGYQFEIEYTHPDKHTSPETLITELISTVVAAKHCLAHAHVDLYRHYEFM